MGGVGDLQMGQDLRAMCVALVFRQVAALSAADMCSGLDGLDVSSLVGIDVQKIPMFTPVATTLWASPVQVVVGMSLLVRRRSVET